MKKFLLFVTLVASLSTGSIPANAVWGGKLALGNSFSVAVSGLNDGGGCSGFLYKPRIVLTAGHCLDKPSASNPMTVSPPGISIPEDKSQFPIVETSFVSTQYFNNPKLGAPKFDFRVLVLDKPLVAPLNVRLATNDDIDKLKLSNAIVNYVGYGMPDFSNPYSLNTKILTDPINLYQDYDTHPVNLLMDALDTKETTICPGDSGGPWVYLEGSTIVYLGATSTLNGFNPCQKKYLDSTNNWAEITTVVNFVNIIQEAIDYVAAHPIATPLSTPSSPVLGNKNQRKPVAIASYCIKGKTFLKLNSKTHVCPKGYKMGTK